MPRKLARPAENWIHASSAQQGPKILTKKIAATLDGIINRALQQSSKQKYVLILKEASW